MRICNSTSDHDPSNLKTLLWIGDRHSPALQAAYRYCESNVSQLAYRSSIDEAIERPAGDVSRIVLAQLSRQPIGGQAWHRLVLRHESAATLRLLGPLCGSERGVQQPAGASRCHWHQWSHVLPNWLNVQQQTTPTKVASVLVIADAADAADPLLDVAEQLGVAAVWWREPLRQRGRGFETVWWDDSAAVATDTASWIERREQSGAIRSNCQHVWLVNGPTEHACNQAQAGGVSTILAKPFLIDGLIASLNAPQNANRLACSDHSHDPRSVVTVAAA